MESDEWHYRLQEHAEAIGFVCIKWSWLELVIDCFVAHLLGLRIGATEARVLVANMDLNAKITVVRVLGHDKRPSDLWFDELDKALKVVDVVRPLRNRVVHDIWNPPEQAGEHATRTFARSKLARTQSHQPLHLTTHEIVEMTKTDIVKIANQIQAVCHTLLDLGKQLPGWADNAAPTTDETMS
jgi:hypothetical protein